VRPTGGGRGARATEGLRGRPTGRRSRGQRSSQSDRVPRWRTTALLWQLFGCPTVACREAGRAGPRVTTRKSPPARALWRGPRYQWGCLASPGGPRGLQACKPQGQIFVKAVNELPVHPRRGKGPVWTRRDLSACAFKRPPSPGRADAPARIVRPDVIFSESPATLIGNLLTV